MTDETRHWLWGPLLLVALAMVAWLAWLVRVELVVLFAAALFGIALFRAARWLSRHTGLGHGAAVVLWYVAGVVAAGAFLLFAGDRLSSQYGELSEELPAALRTVETRIADVPVVGSVAGQLASVRESMTGQGESGGGGGDAPEEGAEEGEGGESGSMRLVRLTMRTVTLFVVWAVLSFYIAWDGSRYRRAVERLVPEGRRHVAEDLMNSLEAALPWWLIGRLASMGVVALLTAPALLVLGVPLAFLLAIIAGLFSFVPFVGPIAAVIPAVLITLEAVPDKLPWVLAVYGTVQFLESYLVTPRIQDRVASVPPVLLISSQLLMGTIVGIVGVMFATPLVLAAMVVVQVLYLRHGLGQPLETPQEGRG